jgi:hypothetical protein
MNNQDHMASRALATEVGGARGVEADPRIGQFAAVRDSWRTEVVGPISKVTAQRIYYPATHNAKREAFSDLTSVLYIGEPAVAARLCEVIKSSSALSDQDCRAARLRHEMRIKAAIAKATSPPSTPSPTGRDHGEGELW